MRSSETTALSTLRGAAVAVIAFHMGTGRPPTVVLEDCTENRIVVQVRDLLAAVIALAFRATMGRVCMLMAARFLFKLPLSLLWRLAFLLC